MPEKQTRCLKNGWKNNNKQQKNQYSNLLQEKKNPVQNLSSILHLSALQPWATWAASSCMGSLCASHRPNTPASSFLVKATRTRAWPKTTATPPCTASRSLDPKTTPTSSHPLPPYTSPTSRKSSNCSSRNIINTWPVGQTEVTIYTRLKLPETCFNANVSFVFLAHLWLRMTSRCFFPHPEPWSRPSSSSSESFVYCLSYSLKSCLSDCPPLSQSPCPCSETFSLLP